MLKSLRTRGIWVVVLVGILVAGGFPLILSLDQPLFGSQFTEVLNRGLSLFMGEATASSAAPISTFIAADLESSLTLERFSSEVTDIVFAPDNSLLAASALNGGVMVWDLEDGDLLFDLNGHEAGVNSIAFSPDGSLLATGSNDSKVRLWNTEDGSVVRTLNSNLAGRALSVAFSPNGDMIAIGGHLCTVELRLVSTGLLTRTIRIPFCNNALNGSVKYLPLVFSPDGTQLAIGSGLPGTRGRIFLVKMERFSTPQLIADFDMLVSDLDFNEQELFLAASLAGSSRVWLMDAMNGVVRNIFEGHAFRVKSVSFSPDGQLLATGSQDGTMRLWGTNIGLLLRVLEIDPSGVNKVVFSPDGSKIATGTASGQVFIWGLAPAK